MRDNRRYLAQSATDADLDRAVYAIGMQHLLRRLGGYDLER